MSGVGDCLCFLRMFFPKKHLEEEAGSFTESLLLVQLFVV